MKTVPHKSHFLHDKVYFLPDPARLTTSKASKYKADFPIPPV
jgi:hypothetical protein